MKTGSYFVHVPNVTAIGDAAHAPLPTSGQGACQALEDAWHLAQCLKRNSTDIEATFVDFTDVRKSKTTGIINTGRQLANSIFNTDFAVLQTAKSGQYRN